MTLTLEDPKQRRQHRHKTGPKPQAIARVLRVIEATLPLKADAVSVDDILEQMAPAAVGHHTVRVALAILEREGVAQSFVTKRVGPRGISPRRYYRTPAALAPSHIDAWQDDGEMYPKDETDREAVS